MEDRSAADLVEEYLRLGGSRKSANDDNLTSTRKWESESAEAKQFWDQAIAPLGPERRKEVETLLPSISEE